jgi:three-Cys-motif partner protein
MVMDTIGENALLAECLHMSFYEEDRDYVTRLGEELRAHPAYQSLAHEPQIIPRKIDASFIAEIAPELSPATFSFIDPFGYSDISIDLVDTVSGEWGCDCLFYLSISGLVRNLKESTKEAKLRSFFGDDSFNKVQEHTRGTTVTGRTSEILFKEIESALRKRGKNYVLRYLVEYEKAKTESHYLVFLSKDSLGFKIMRDIMIARSLKDANGLPLLAHSPRNQAEQDQGELDFPRQPLEELSMQLTKQFHNQNLSVSDLMANCLKLGYPYQDSHIRRALAYLRENGQIEVRDQKGDVVEKRILNKHFVKFV